MAFTENGTWILKILTKEPLTSEFLSDSCRFVFTHRLQAVAYGWHTKYRTYMGDTCWILVSKQVLLDVSLFRLLDGALTFWWVYCFGGSSTGSAYVIHWCPRSNLKFRWPAYEMYMDTRLGGVSKLYKLAMPTDTKDSHETVYSRSRFTLIQVSAINLDLEPELRPIHQ